MALTRFPVKHCETRRPEGERESQAQRDGWMNDRWVGMDLAAYLELRDVVPEIHQEGQLGVP